MFNEVSQPEIDEDESIPTGSVQFLEMQTNENQIRRSSG